MRIGKIANCITTQSQKLWKVKMGFLQTNVRILYIEPETSLHLGEPNLYSEIMTSSPTA